MRSEVVRYLWTVVEVDSSQVRTLVELALAWQCSDVFSAGMVGVMARRRNILFILGILGDSQLTVLGSGLLVRDGLGRLRQSAFALTAVLAGAPRDGWSVCISRRRRCGSLGGRAGVGFGGGSVRLLGGFGRQ